MADPLSVIGGLASILQISSMVVRLIKTAKESFSERQKLLAEINATTALCQTLNDYVDMNGLEEWMPTLAILGRDGDGPVAQFQTSLLFLEKKLGAESGLASSPAPNYRQQAASSKERLKVLTQKVTWPFSKGEVLKTLASIERQKSLFAIALTNDNVRLSMALLDETRHVRNSLDVIRTSQAEGLKLAAHAAQEVDAIRTTQERETQLSHNNQDNKDRQALLAKMTTIDFESTHADISSHRAKGTGEWFLETPEYLLWRDGPSNALTCRGIPGAGKTVLTSLVIDSLRGKTAMADEKRKDPSSTSRIGVAGIYCSYRSPQSTMNMIGSVLRQLLEPLETIPVSAQGTLSKETLLAIFTDLSRFYATVYIVIDALDECENRIELLNISRGLLDTFSSESGKNFLHLLFTSRFNVVADIERILKSSIRFEIRSSDEDVGTFLKQNLRDHGQLREWVCESPDFETLIIDAILARLSGMFLLARLYMDLLAHIPTKRGVRRALQTLPEGTDDTYAEAWNRICAQRSHQAALGKRIISWIIHATRPLRVEEMRYALAVEDGDDELDPEGLIDAAALVSFCAGLVVINEQSNLISLVHPTTQEYFKDRRKCLFPGAHEDIAMTCIIYLRMKPFRNEGSLDDFEAFTVRRCSHRLLGYAAVNWGFHVRTADTERATLLALSLLLDKPARLAALQALTLNTVGQNEFGTEWPERTPPGYPGSEVSEFRASRTVAGALHVAAYFGLINAAKMLLQDKNDVDELDGYNGTAVHWALLDRQNMMLKFLLERGANPNVERDQATFFRWHELGIFTLPLCIAAYMGNIAAMQHLLRHQAQVEQRQTKHGDETSLTAALYARQDEAARMLMAKGADINLEDREIRHTAKYGSLETLVMLIGGADQEKIQVGLSAAASAGQHDKIMLLLKCGADPNGFADTCYGNVVEKDDSKIKPSNAVVQHNLNATPLVATPLVEAIVSSWGYKDGADSLKCFSTLMEAGADPNGISSRKYFYADDFITSKSRNSWSRPTGRKTTPLHTAAYYARLDMVRTLVEKGADVNLSLGRQNTALKAAIDSESYDDACVGAQVIESSSLRVRSTLQLLIDLGADTNLCAPSDKERIERLLNMAPADLEKMAALQKIVVQPHFGIDCADRSFRERTDELKALLGGGGDPELCCARDRKRIEQFLAWTEEEIEAWDRGWRSYQTMIERMKQRPF